MGAERLSDWAMAHVQARSARANQPQDRVTDHRVGFNGTYNGVLLGDAAAIRWRLFMQQSADSFAQAA